MIAKKKARGAKKCSFCYAFPIVILMVVVLFVPARSQTNENPVGAASILRSGVDARALGMGGAFVAVADNYSASY